MRTGVFGAGAVGGFLGVALSAAGIPVVLVGRRALVVVRDQLLMEPLGGAERSPGADLVVTDDPEHLGAVDLCLVTVKSRDTEAAAAQLAGVLPPDTLVVSFQNGLDNVRRLREGLTQPVAAGVVSFNVRRDGGRFRQLTSGPVLVEALEDPRAQALRGALARAGLRAKLRRDIDDVAAGKLLLNLNNGVCAATGLGIAASLQSPDARRCFARCIQEGLTVMRDADLKPVGVLPIPPGLVARFLTGPEVLLRPLTRLLVRVDPAARSSTLQDLDRGRPTEIDALNGAIVALAESLGREAPVNARVVQVVRRIEARVARGEAPDFVPPAELLRALDG